VIEKHCGPKRLDAHWATGAVEGHYPQMKGKRRGMRERNTTQKRAGGGSSASCPLAEKIWNRGRDWHKMSDRQKLSVEEIMSRGCSRETTRRERTIGQQTGELKTLVVPRWRTRSAHEDFVPVKEGSGMWYTRECQKREGGGPRGEGGGGGGVTTTRGFFNS